MNRHDFDFEVYGNDAAEIERKAKEHADRFFGDRRYTLYIQSDLLSQTIDGGGYGCKAKVSVTDLAGGQ